MASDYIEKDLGIVTAYGEAVAGGYRGTREDFRNLLARMANSYLTYEDLNDKPKINGVELTGNKTTSQLGISTGSNSYADLSNKPSINNVTLSGNKSLSDLGIASASSLSSLTTEVSNQKNYNNLSNRPQINGVVLSGNKTASDLGISGATNYNNLTNRPQINGVTLSGNKTTSDLNIKPDINIINGAFKVPLRRKSNLGDDRFYYSGSLTLDMTGGEADRIISVIGVNITAGSSDSHRWALLYYYIDKNNRVVDVGAYDTFRSETDQATGTGANALIAQIRYTYNNT